MKEKADYSLTIWNSLMKAICNPYGVAALMGNLFAESSLNPECKTGSKYKEISSSEYISNVDNGTINEDTFIHDDVAFGLAQWRYWSRKKALYELAKEQHKSIGDINLQIDFLIKEIKTYKMVWNAMIDAAFIKDASDIILTKYERPANVGDAVKEKRASYGEKYYDKFSNMSSEPIAEPVIDHDVFVITSTNNVNLRSGNGREYSIVKQIAKKDTYFSWVATADNGWHAIRTTIDGKPRVLWISGDFSEVKEC